MEIATTLILCANIVAFLGILGYNCGLEPPIEETATIEVMPWWQRWIYKSGQVCKRSILGCIREAPEISSFASDSFSGCEGLPDYIRQSYIDNRNRDHRNFMNQQTINISNSAYQHRREVNYITNYGYRR